MNYLTPNNVNVNKAGSENAEIAVISESLFPALCLVGWGRTREVKGENSGLEARTAY